MKGMPMMGMPGGNHAEAEQVGLGMPTPMPSNGRRPAAFRARAAGRACPGLATCGTRALRVR